MKTVTKEYSILFNEITDVSEALKNLCTRMEEAQRRAEELFVEDEEEWDGPDSCLRKPG